jgi:dUTP pyrophosphatase
MDPNPSEEFRRLDDPFLCQQRPSKSLAEDGDKVVQGEGMQNSEQRSLKIQFVQIHPDAKLPTRAHQNDAGYDLHAIEDTVILPGKIAAVRTGLQLAGVFHSSMEHQEFPRFTTSSSGLGQVLSFVNETFDYSPQVFLDVRSRSGLSMKLLVIVTGTVDIGYRGEIKVVMANLSDDAYTIHAGDRIAQLVVQVISEADLEFVTEATASSRGSGGFGSSGR